jgi:hypothetical protein
VNDERESPSGRLETAECSGRRLRQFEEPSIAVVLADLVPEDAPFVGSYRVVEAANCSSPGSIST